MNGKEKQSGLFPLSTERQCYTAVILLCVTFGLLYWDGIAWLFSQWSNDKLYSHGFFVPLLSLYLVWEQRERFRLLPARPAYAAAAPVIAGCLALLLISRLSVVIQLEVFSLFFFIPGLLLFLFGWQTVRAALLPWLYLQFMIPWMDPVLDRIHKPFQLVTAEMAVRLLSFKYAVYHDGVHIALPDISMEVAAVCSGVKFLISVVAIGIPLVYLTQRTWLRAFAVLVAGCLITILSNGLRVAMAGVMGQTYGPAMLHGPGHILQGWFVAWVGWIGLFLVNWLVARSTSEALPRLSERWRTSAGLKPPATGSLASGGGKTPLWSGVALLAASIAVVSFLSPRPVPLPDEPAVLPLNIVGWKGKDAAWLDEESFFPNTDRALQRVYYSGNGKPFYLYVGYYEKQSEPKRLVSRFSRPLHRSAQVVQLGAQSANDGAMFVNKGDVVSKGREFDSYFWYQLPDGKVLTERKAVRLAMLRSGLLDRQNNGAVVLIAKDKSSPRDDGRSAREIDLFYQALGPYLRALLP